MLVKGTQVWNLLWAVTQNGNPGLGFWSTRICPISINGICISQWCARHRNRMVRSWASYQIRKIAGCACAGNAGNVFPRRRFQRKSLVNDPDMHHGTCVTHVPWCMSGSFTCGDGENVPGIPGACAPAILRIWQEAHGLYRLIPLTKASDVELWYFLWSLPEQKFEYIIETPGIWDAIAFIMTSRCGITTSW